MQCIILLCENYLKPLRRSWFSSSAAAAHKAEDPHGAAASAAVTAAAYEAKAPIAAVLQQLCSWSLRCSC